MDHGMPRGKLGFPGGYVESRFGGAMGLMVDKAIHS